MSGNVRPILYMIAAAAGFTVVNMGVKYLDHMGTFQLVFFRAIGSAICCFLYLWKSGIPVIGNDQRILILRSIVGLISITLFFRAVQIMPFASAVALRYLSPLFATVFAVIFLHERVKPLQWLFVVIAFGGVVLIKGFDPRISLAALIIILLSALFSGLVYMLIRKIGTSEHPVVIVNYFMTISAVVTGLLAIPNWTMPVNLEWLAVLTMGLFGFFAQLLMTRALQLAEANTVTPFKYSEVIFSIAVGWVVFGEYMTTAGAIGIAVIIASLIAIVRLKRRQKRSS